VIAPAGTTAVAVVSLTTAHVAAEVPLKITPSTPTNPVPVIVTEVPTGPQVGVKDVTVAAAAGLALTSTTEAPRSRASAPTRTADRA
jgi:hypothetical protein